MLEKYVAFRRDTGEEIDFPVEWPSEADAQNIWRWDAEHNAFPTTPLSGSLGRMPGMAGPGGRGGGINVHGYRYSPGGRPGGVPGARNAGQDLADALARIDETWTNGDREQILRESHEIFDRDYEAMSLAELVDWLEGCRAKGLHHVEIMFRALDIAGFGRNQLAEVLQRVLPQDEPLEAVLNELLQGYPSATFEANVALWDVAQLAAASDELRFLVETADAGTIRRQAPALEGGGAFLEAFEAWLKTYGRRSGEYSELSWPTWYEDPTAVVSLIRGLMDTEDPREILARNAAKREERAAQIEAGLSSEDAGSFRDAYAKAAKFLPVKESRNSAMSLSRGSLRQPALAAGRKLVGANAIDAVQDVFYLTLDEIRDVAEGRAKDLRNLIPARRAEHETWRNVVPPSFIGEPAKSLPASEAGTIRGIAASRGIVTGRARVILSVSEGYRLQPGEILVTRSTTSAWTPLFLTAAGLVTDGGGTLSHAAVLARECGLPAVVGAYTATRYIADGATITVDGSRGVVTIEAD